MDDKITKGVEFVNPHIEYTWTAEPNFKEEGVTETIFYKDENTGTYCRFLSLPPGFRSGVTLLHDFDEIVYIISGTMTNERLNQSYPAGSVAFFPAGIKHGPLNAPDGVLALEFRYFKKVS